MMESRIRTIPKILLVPLMPLIFLFTMGDSCGNNQSSAPGNTNSCFTFEYDYMIGYDVFALGTSYADNVYATCNTNLDIWTDQVNIPASSPDHPQVLNFLRSHAQIHLPSTCINYVYKAHLFGMQEETNPPVQPPEYELGRTYYPVNDCDPSDSNTFAVVFVKTIQGLPSPPINIQKMIEKTVIHELGHARKIKTHLCLGSVQNPLHNDPACVMGQGYISLCTSYDIYLNPKFCPNDIQYLKNVNW